jgi:hypothetical protein
VQLGVALLVAFERRARAVVAPAVELDDQLAVGPVRVDLVAVYLRVRDGAGDLVAIAEVEECRLELAAGVGELVGDQLVQRLRSWPPGACCLQ